MEKKDSYKLKLWAKGICCFFFIVVESITVVHRCLDAIISMETQILDSYREITMWSLDGILLSRMAAWCVFSYGGFFFILFYRIVSRQVSSVRRALIDAWQLAFSVQVNPLAAVQQLPSAASRGSRWWFHLSCAS